MNKNIAYSQEKQVGHSHNNAIEIGNLENAIAKKLKGVQLIFDADSVKGFNETGALDQISSGGAPEWEQKIQMSYLKRRYIDTKYNLNKYTSSKGGIPIVQAPCTNVGFENGTTSGWTITEGINLNSLTMGGCCPNPSTRYSIVTPGVDPTFPTLQQVPVGGGNYALMIGDGIYNGGYAVRVSQTFSVTPLNTLFIYKFAAILESADHTCAEQPYMDISFTDASNNPISCGQFNVVQPGAGCTSFPVDPTFTSVTVGTYTYNVKDWSTRAFDLSGYIGQNVTVAFTVSDCTVLGHAGYCYVDASCVPMTLSLNGVDLPFGQTSTTFCSGVTSNTLCAPTGFTYNWTGPGVTGQTGQCINPASSGTHSVNLGIIGSAIACSTVPKLYTSFNIIPSPTITIASVSNPTICSGNSTTITPSGASTYTLNPGGLTGTSFVISPTATTIYSITGTSSLSCSSVNTATTQIVVNVIPTITVNSATICSGNAATLTSTLSLGSSSSGTTITSFSNYTDYTISDNTPTGITSTIAVTGITGLVGTSLASVCLNISHTYDQDLTLKLTCPNGNSINLAVAAGGSGDNFTSTCFSNFGTAITLGTAPFTGTYTPQQALSLLSGCTTNGTWSLTAIDGAAGDIGTILDWTLNFITPVPITTPPSSTFSWSPGTNLSTITGSITTATPTITTVYTVTGTTNGCSSTTTSTVTVNAIPISTASTTGSITCVNNSINLNSTLSGAGITYTWTAPAGSSITGSPFTQNTTGQGLGTYTLNLKGPGGCTYSTTVAAIQNTTTPTSVSAGATQTLICGVPTVTLAGSATPTTSTASWLGGVTNTTSFTTTTGSAGTYTLSAIDPTTGCSISSTVSVIQSIGSPSVTADPVTFSITCTNTMVPIGVVVSSTNAVTYQWSTTGISGSTTNSTATATLAGVYNVTVTNSPGNNCTTIKSITVPTDITPVVASITPAATITCSVPTLTLNAVPGGANYTYTWTGTSAIVSGSLTQNPIIDNGGTYSVAITNTVNGCVGYAAITVASNTVLPVVNIAAPSVTTTCTNPTVTLVVVSTPSTGVTYSWTAPATGTLSSYTISNPIASGSGIFTVVVTNSVSGCSSALTQNTIVVIPDFAVPTTTLSATSVSITCSNPTPSVSITTTVSPVSYSWTPTIGIVAGTGNTANPSFSLAGTYSAVVTNYINGCSTNTSDNVVTVNLNITVPTVTLSNAAANDGTLTCTTLSVVVTPTVIPSAANYTWTSSTGTISSQSTVTLTSVGIYTLTVVDPINGCVTSNTNTANTFTVYQNITVPTVTLSNTAANTGTLTCTTLSVVVTPTTNPSVANYTWTSSTGIISTQSVVTLTSAGIYTLTVVDPINGCVTSNTNTANTFTVYQNIIAPIINVTPISTNSVIGCGVNSSVTYSANVTTVNGIPNYSWSPSGGSGGNTSPVFNATIAGTYTLLVTNTLTGCSTAKIFTVIGNSIIPNLNSTATVTTPCGSTITVLSASSTNTNVGYTWIGPPASIITGSATSNPTVNLQGSYVVTVTDLLTGCTNSSTVTVIQTVITAAFTADPSTGLAPLTVNFTNQSTGATSYSWDFGNGLTSTDKNPTTIYGIGGT